MAVINNDMVIKENVEVRKRCRTEDGWTDWKILQREKNIVTNTGLQWMLDLATGDAVGSITHFEVGGGGRETNNIDNSSGTTEISLPLGTDEHNRVAQTFYPTTGTISRVTVKPRTNTGTPLVDIVMNFFNTSGADEANPTGTVVPTGTVIASQDCRASTWDAFIGSELTFGIVNDTLVIGSRYAAVLRNSGTTIDNSNHRNIATWSGNDTDDYTSGNVVIFSGTGWSVQSGSQDFYFKDWFPTDDGAPIAKTASSNTLTIPTLEKTITSNSRTANTTEFVLDLTAVDANVPGKVSEARMMYGPGSPALSAVAFRDEDKTEDNEMQIVWEWTASSS